MKRAFAKPGSVLYNLIADRKQAASKSQDCRAVQIFCMGETAGRVRVNAQKWCAGMTRDHCMNRDVYSFNDGSQIVVSVNRVTITQANGMIFGYDEAAANRG